MISIEEVKKKIEDIGYFATEELIYDAYNALQLFETSSKSTGQDIFAICLEGPPGAGKTEFAKTYTKLANNLFKNVELVDYQCDATTGKTELFEDINISAAIRNDADNVVISGKLIEAIKKVNSGKKVVLFIDEYDKAREETDAFLLQFLQSGKINSTQHGDLEVKEEYKGNLQVILCKNDMREELSGPLSRRIRIVRLDYMEPSIFYKVASRVLLENNNPVSNGLVNLVSLMYEKAYANKEMYNRLPSCSEMLIAIEDADRMMKTANAPQYILYNIIIRNMFKSEDDISTFESSLNKMKNQNESGLAALVKGMKIDKTTDKKVDLNHLIATKVFNNESTVLTSKIEEMQKLINEYKIKFNDMETMRKQSIDEEIKKIKLQNGSFVSTNLRPDVTNIFEDENPYIKRGCNIFEISNSDWIEIATIEKPNLSYNDFNKSLIENAAKLDIKIYENGILLKEDGDQKLIIISSIEDKKVVNKILSNYQVIPSTFLSDIINYISYIIDFYENQIKSTAAVVNNYIGINGSYLINTLIYNDKEIDSLSKEYDNVYYFETSSSLEKEKKSNKFIDKNIDKIKSLLSCSDSKKAIEASKNMTNEKIKVFN